MAYKKEFVSVNHSPKELEDLINTRFKDGWDIMDIKIEFFIVPAICYRGYIIFSYGASLK